MKKALVFDPYLNTLGGGERYVLTLAKLLSESGYEVTVAWSNKDILQEAQNRFNMDYANLIVSVEDYYLLVGGSLASKYSLTKKYDLTFWVSDGSLPFLFSKQNYIHLQVPFKKIGGNPILNAIKTMFIDKFIYNSKFTQSIVETSLSKNKGLVLYPPVDIDQFSAGKKENIIIAVGRFDSPLNDKRQDVLISAFSLFHEKNPGFELILIGGLLGEELKADNLKILAKGLPVKFVLNPDFNTLKDYYSKARFFWHAAGFGVNEELEPEKVEHFGITTVEAMAAGCIPVVIAKGGQKEIIFSPKSLCNTPGEISAKTLDYLDNPNELDSASQLFKEESKKFSLSVFNSKVQEIIGPNS